MIHKILRITYKCEACPDEGPCYYTNIIGSFTTPHIPEHCPLKSRRYTEWQQHGYISVISEEE